LTARVPAWRIACPAANRPTVADRRRREVGMGSFGTPQPRWTCDPATMSSEPSGQRTQALWPPS
jgi:hypothetical protein